MEASRVAWLLFISALVVSAQDGWRAVPAVPLGPNDVNLVGVTGEAAASRGAKNAKARIVIAASPKWGTAEMGIWIEGISGMIGEKELWPFEGPDLRRAASNPRMIEIKLISSAGELKMHSPMGVASGGNYPKGAVPADDDVLCPNLRDDELRRLLKRMNAGFDYGVVTIGQGVFSPPVVVRFDGNGINGKLRNVLDLITHPRPIVPHLPSK